MNVFVTQTGEDFIIESEYEDGLSWFGDINNAIENYCDEHCLVPEQVSWYASVNGIYRQRV